MIRGIVEQEIQAMVSKRENIATHHPYQAWDPVPSLSPATTGIGERRQARTSVRVTALHHASQAVCWVCCTHLQVGVWFKPRRVSVFRKENLEMNGQHCLLPFELWEAKELSRMKTGSLPEI